MSIHIVFIITGIFIIASGFMIKHFKFCGLITGFNTIRAEEKVNFDTEKFALLMRNVFLIIGIIIIISSLISMWSQIELLSPIVNFLVIIIGVVYLNIQGARFKISNKKRE